MQVKVSFLYIFGRQQNEQLKNVFCRFFCDLSYKTCTIKSAAICNAFWLECSVGATFSNAAPSPRRPREHVKERADKAHPHCDRFAPPHCCYNPFFSCQNTLVCNSTLGFRVLPFALRFDKRVVLWICFANGFVFNGLLVTFISPSFLVKMKRNESKAKKCAV